MAFWLLGVNWLGLGMIEKSETRTLLYLLRLVAFTALIIGIVDKNRTRRP
jgi:hypothetical protein